MIFLGRGLIIIAKLTTLIKLRPKGCTKSVVLGPYGRVDLT